MTLPKTLQEMMEAGAKSFGAIHDDGEEAKHARVAYRVGWKECLKALMEMGEEFPEREAKEEHDRFWETVKGCHGWTLALHMARWAWSLAQAKIAAKDAEIERLKDSPYCSVCGNCGVEECCPTKCCKYPPEKVKELDAKLKEAEGVIEFYADRDNWVTNSGKVMVTLIWTDDHDGEMPRWAGGKRARAYLRDKGV